MAFHNRHDHHGRKLRKPVLDPRLLEFFKELYVRNKQLFKKLFPKFHGDSFEEFTEHFEATCSEAKKRFAHRYERDDTVLQRSLSVGSPRMMQRGFGGDEEPLKLERFKVRMVDIDGDEGDPPPGGGGGGGCGGGGGGGCGGGVGGTGQNGPKPDGSKSK